jgi:MoaA/NifB/PqqE/SkfB family radical SAM enzyme
MTGIREFGYRVVQLEVTNRCNMACSFCPLPIRDLPLADIAPKEAFDLIDTIAGIGGVDFIAFHQFGEPLLYPRIWECLDRCREVGLRSQLVTNGLLLTDRNIDKLFAHPPDILRISAQTLNPAHHAATRGVDVDFDTYVHRVASCIARLVDHNPGIEEIRTDVAVNDDRYNGVAGKILYLKHVAGVIDAGDPTIYNETPRSLQPHLVGLLRLVERLSRSFRFSQAHLDECTARYYSHETGTDGWETAYELGENNSITYKRFINGRRISQNYAVERALCGTEILGILADGTVTCCCLDYEGFTGIGNIFSEDLLSILRRNQEILDGLHTTGMLHFEACKKCLGAPTRVGAAIKNAVNRVRHR